MGLLTGPPDRTLSTTGVEEVGCEMREGTGVVGRSDSFNSTVAPITFSGRQTDSPEVLGFFVTVAPTVTSTFCSRTGRISFGDRTFYPEDRPCRVLDFQRPSKQS